MTAPTPRETADHAELARWLREDADWQRKMKGGTTNDRKLDEAADAILALLSEIAALRGEKDQANKNADGYKLAAEIHLESATQAERQRDELRKELEFIKGVVTPDQGSSMTDIERVIFVRISRILANQGADQ